MKEKRISKPTRKGDVPYDVANAGDVTACWETATKHRGVEEPRAKRGRPPKAERDYLRLGAGWQTPMNAAAKAYRGAKV